MTLINRFGGVLALSLLWAFAAIARPDGVFELGRSKPTRAVITARDAYPADSLGGSPMLRELSGIIAELNARDTSLLAQAVLPGSKMVDARGTLFRVGVVHLIGKSESERKRVELLLSPDGVVLAQELDTDDGKETKQGRVVKLDSEKFRQASIEWSRYRGGFGGTHPGLRMDESKDAALAAGIEAPLAAPLTPAPFFLDQKLLGDRFLSGRRSNIAGATRVLSAEKMTVRTPKEYDPARPAGLLVWINAGPQGSIPPMFVQAMDELNIACVGIENVGNDRAVAERYQLALDAVFAASARVHVDPRRVYVTGISGGGRVSSMMQACFADYFTGAVPIVGLSCYERVPLGNSRYAPAGYSKPREARFGLFKTRRMAAITGDQDFNHSEIESAASIMQKDGVRVRVFDYEKFGHQMPSPAQFLEAIKWVDEPYQQAIAKERESAEALLAKYIKKHGEAPATDAGGRAELVKVTEMAAWSEAAWRAVEWLRTP